MGEPLKVTVEAVVDLTPQVLARGFCALYDEDQAQFFIEVAKIAKSWTEKNERSFGADWQWHSVGRHLATCACAHGSLEMVETVLYAIQKGAGDS